MADEALIVIDMQNDFCPAAHSQSTAETKSFLPSIASSRRLRMSC